MARIAGVDLPKDKRIDIGLTYVFGIGRAAALAILKKAGVDGSIRVKDVSEDKIVKMREVIERDYRVEGDLRKEVSMNIKRLVDTGTFRGLRHRKGFARSRTADQNKRAYPQRETFGCGKQTAEARWFKSIRG